MNASKFCWELGWRQLPLCSYVRYSLVSSPDPPSTWRSGTRLGTARDVDNFLEVGGGRNLYGAVGSNLQMVRPSLMSVVKLSIIHAREVCGKILDLASYLVVRWRSHCTSASNWELPLLCYPTLQGTSSLIKSWENTYNFSYCCERENLQCIAQVEDLATYNSTASSTERYCMSTRTELTICLCAV